MKIAAGGLQVQVLDEVLRAFEGQRPRSLAGQEIAAQGRETAQLLHDLNRAVERLNQAAEAFNYPLQFSLRRRQEGDKRQRGGWRVVVRHKESGEEREMSVEDVLRLAGCEEATALGRGWHVDDYA